MGRERIEAGCLSATELRHVANEVWLAVANEEWKEYRSALRGGGSDFRVYGGSQMPSAQPSSRLEGRGIADYALPDERLGIDRGVAFYLDGKRWDALLDGLNPSLWVEARAALKA